MAHHKTSLTSHGTENYLFTESHRYCTILQELLGKSILELAHPEDQGLLRDSFQQVGCMCQKRTVVVCGGSMAAY